MASRTSGHFNADQVFWMAERVEQCAAEMYTLAAGLHAAEGDAAFLRKLADMEYRHRDMIAAQRARLPPEARELPCRDPYLKATVELAEIAGAGAGEGRFSMARPLKATDTLEQILERALQGELEAVAFYDSLRNAVPAECGRKELDVIIAEEKRHVVDLNRRLRDLRAHSTSRTAARSAGSSR